MSPGICGRMNRNSEPGRRNAVAGIPRDESLPVCCETAAQDGSSITANLIEGSFDTVARGSGHHRFVLGQDGALPSDRSRGHAAGARTRISTRPLPPSGSISARPMIIYRASRHFGATRNRLPFDVSETAARRGLAAGKPASGSDSPAMAPGSRASETSGENRRNFS